MSLVNCYINDFIERSRKVTLIRIFPNDRFVDVLLCRPDLGVHDCPLARSRHDHVLSAAAVGGQHRLGRGDADGSGARGARTDQ